MSVTAAEAGPANKSRGLGRLLPGRRDYAGLRQSWKADVVAGVTVSVVALPLALGFGIASGVGAGAGLITAIVAGLIAGIFGGSNVQVSGPTGAMTVVLIPIVAQHGSMGVLVVGMMAGALVLLSSLSGVGRYLAFMPWPVVEGFTAGIAIIIFLQQVPAALGVAKPEGEKVVAVAFRAATQNGLNLASAGLVLLVAAIMFTAPKLHRSVPGSLLAVLAATLVAQTLPLSVARVGALPGSLPLPSLPAISWGGLNDLFLAAVAVAFLAALESLLSAKVADGMADSDRHDPDRELFGQGLANLLSAVFGGMPATGAIARTAVNVRAGAQSRLATIVHAATLLAIVSFGSGLVSQIPIAALSGVLMVTAFRMVEIHNEKAVLRSTRSDAAVLVTTALATVAFDLTVAVEIGIGVAAVLALRHIANVSEAEPEPLVLDDSVTSRDEARFLRDHIVVYRLDGAMFFGVAHTFLMRLTDVGDVRVVVLRLSQLQMLDATGAQALGEIITTLQARGVTVLLKGIRPRHRQLLEAVGALDRLAKEHHMFDTLEAAIAHAKKHVHDRGLSR
jgi:SulP family sulfate permease